MCGIVGIVNYFTNIEEHHRDILTAMNESQVHRGPDGEGYYLNTHVGLGHKRLAIIDIVHGQQPMQTADGKLILIYNGEIFNFQELRKELKREGFHFSTASDTEVLLKSYEAWGKDCLARFNGDFAFAIWDEVMQELFLARDRLGVKPLYYTQVGHSFLFASEAKALLKFAGVSRAIDMHALVEGLAYFQPLVPNTLIRGIKVLEPGHYIVINRAGMRKVKYWDLVYTGCSDTLAQAKEKISWLLEDAIKLRMISDVPICGLLSGGLDSSILCTLMSKNSDRPINTFSINFEGNRPRPNRVIHITGDDLDYAEEVANEINANHHSIISSADEYFDLLHLAAYAREMPVAHGSEPGILRLCKDVKRHATVALSGEGADEIALGYYMFVNKKALDGQLKPFFVARANRFMFILSPRLRAAIKPVRYIQDKFQDYLEKLPVLWDREEHRNLNTMHYLQIKYVLPYLLDRADRLSMASSVELRVPFCDHRLVEYFFNLNPKLKFIEGVEKYVLREAFRGRVCQRVVERKKSVFPYPFSEAALQKLYDATFKVLSARNQNGHDVGKVYARSSLRVIALLARLGLIPPIGAHFIFTYALTLAYVYDNYGLEFDFA